MMQSSFLHTHFTAQFVIYIFCLLPFSSFGQSELTFINESQFIVDSIIFEGTMKIKLTALKPLNDTTIYITAENTNLHSVVPCSYRIYYNQLSFFGQCKRSTGIMNEVDSVFILNHGISDSNRLKCPTNFTLYFNNVSNKKINSFASDSRAIISISELTPRFFKIEIDYRKIQKYPDISVELDGKRYFKNLSFHRFDNWNDTLAEIWFDSDTIYSGTVPVEKTKEC